MQNKKLKMRCDIARSTDRKYRDQNGLIGAAGYTLTFGRHCMGFSNELPDIAGRNPLCVDQDGDCFTPLDKNIWQCVTSPQKIPPPERNSEHIKIVAFKQTVLTFPNAAEQIRDWFFGCTVPLDSNKWRRFESFTLATIYEFVRSGKSADEVLS